MPSSFKELRVWREALKFTVSPFIGRPATSPDTGFTELHSSYDVPRFRFPATLLKEKDTDQIANLETFCRTQRDRCWKYRRN